MNAANTPPTFTIATLGCKVNQYETQAIREAMAAAGYVEADGDAPVDVVIVNTCVVTTRARRKAFKRITRVLRHEPREALVVTGCLADTEAEKLREMGVVVLPKDAGARIADILHGDAVACGEADVFEMRVSAFEGHTRAFLKIEDGCDSFCSYCIVPHARGRVRSRPRADVRAEVERLVAAGHAEIVLCGIHLGHYGRDLDGATLHDIIDDALGVPGLQRLRLSSIEVNEVSDRLIGLIADAPRLCPHLHLPLQSGDDEILRRMNRRTTAYEFMETVDRVRARVPEISLTTDVLVGFPGETDAQFAHTLALCRAAGFSRMHVFPFSPRPGTPAADMPDRVPSEAKRARVRAAEALADELALAVKQRFVGRVVRPLVEHRRDRATGRLCGYTEHYLHVLFDGPEELMGRIVDVRALDATPAELMGRMETTKAPRHQGTEQKQRQRNDGHCEERTQ